ncbi:MAG TPA: WG repeat-containing protein [Bacteroidia bacterium]|nr:WG repeat-containing protein [Bacteroidia bacterium]
MRPPVFLRLFFAVAFLLLPFFSFAQQKKIIWYDGNWDQASRKLASYYRVISFDSAGHPAGLVSDYYISGHLQFRGKLVYFSADSEAYDSICTWYYESGAVKSRQLFMNGRDNGFDSVFYENGKLKAALNYSADQKQAHSVSWYPDGHINVIGYRDVESGAGVDSMFYESGRLSGIAHYINGVQEGEFRAWSPGGKLKYVFHYHEGRRDGESITYSSSGCVKRREFYRRDTLTGLSYGLAGKNCDTVFVTFYSSKGFKIYERDYDNNHRLTGILTGDSLTGRTESRQFYPDGHVKSATVSVNRLQYNRNVSFYPDGKIMDVTVYENDREISDSSWYENGMLRSVMLQFPGRPEMDVSFYPDGKKMGETIPDSLLLHIAKDNVACAYGLKNKNEKWVVAPQFSMIYALPDGFFKVTQNGKSGIYSVTGKKIIAPVYDDLDPLYNPANVYYSPGRIAYYPYYGYFIAVNHGKKGLVNSSGAVVLPFSYDDIFLDGSNTRIIVSVNNRNSIADSTGHVGRATFTSGPQFNGSYGYITEYSRENGYRYGIIDSLGNTVLPARFDEVHICGTNPVTFWVKIHDKAGVMDSHGKIVLDTLYSAPSLEADLRDSAVVVSRNGKTGIASLSGEILVALLYDSVKITSPSGGYYCSKGKYGIISEHFSKVSPPVYESLEGFTTGMVNDDDDVFRGDAFVAKSKGKYGVITVADSILFPFVYDNIWLGNNEIAFTRNDTLSVRYRSRLDAEVALTDVVTFIDGLAVFSNDAYLRTARSDSYKEGVVDANGRILMKPVYSILHAGRDGIVFTGHDGRSGIRSPEGKITMLPDVYSNFEYRDGLIYVTSFSGKAGVTNMNAKLVIDTAFYGICGAGEGPRMFWVKTTPVYDTVQEMYDYHGGWFLLNSSGKKIANTSWNYPAYFYNSVAVISGKEKQGLMDRSGKLLLDTVYDDITRDDIGYFLVRKNGLTGFADARGKIIVAPRWNAASGFFGSLMFVYDQEGNAGIVDTTGKMICGISRSGILQYPDSLGAQVFFYTSEEAGSNAQGVNARIQFRDLSEMVTGYDSILLLQGRHAQDAAMNFIYSLAAMNYTGYGLMYAFNTTPYYGYIYPYPVTEITDWNVVADDNSDDDEYNDVTYYTSVTGASSLTFSVRQAEVSCYSPPRGMEYCNTVSDSFMTFGVRGDSIFLLTPDSLFDKNKNYPVLINAMLLAALKNSDNPGFDCGDTSNLFERTRNDFAVCNSGVLFYIATGQPGYTDDGENDNRVPVLLDWKVLRPVMAKNSILKILAKHPG